MDFLSILFWCVVGVGAVWIGAGLLGSGWLIDWDGVLRM